MRSFKRSDVVNVFQLPEVNLDNIRAFVEGFGDKFEDHFAVTENDIQMNVYSAVDGRNTGTTPLLEDNVLIRDEKGMYSQIEAEEWKNTYFSIPDDATDGQEEHHANANATTQEAGL